ncbi:hypothetical protein GCM10011519_23460 [Marmoricola endophyticus]|uniref:Integral membrane bound transporter domain-containing protein n=1 Tax=Marmoricola endophyticus TaxID=2040280 RepID=A0A917F508_9ACTN|nr:hypothetical protein GCM10011519_23460 [Marmoricola endophyticus]
MRCLVVVALAGGLMTALGTEHAYWAMVSAVVPFARPGLRTQLTRGAHRILGTLAGVALAALLLALSPPALVTVLLIGVLQGLTERVVTRHYAAALVLITPLALLAIQLAHPEPVGDLLASRLLETVAGAAIGMAAAVLTRERRPGTVGA